MTPARTRVAGLVGVALAAAAGLVGLSSAPASAAFCPGDGVNVVVDFNGLGGGVQKGCDPNGAGKPADKVFEAGGFNLTPVNNQPGFICRVEGKPTPEKEQCGQTPPSNAYWGLFWSDGKSGKWSYATTGVDGLDVPSGGFVGFSWQGSDKQDVPSAAPVNARPAPKPTPKPTPRPTKKAPVTKAPAPTKAPVASTAPSTVPSAVASASAQASTSVVPSASASASPSASGSTTLEPSETASPTAESAESVSPQSSPLDEPDGVPAWIPVAVIVVLAGAAGGTLWWRRRTGPL